MARNLQLTSIASALVVLASISLMALPSQGFVPASTKIASLFGFKNDQGFTTLQSIHQSLLLRSSLQETDEPSSARTIDDVISNAADRKMMAEQRKREWIDRSVRYYSKVMREEQRRRMGQIRVDVEKEKRQEDEFVEMAMKHYFAIRKVKSGEWRHAERIYRRIIDELSREEEGHCDHAKLAVSTLLLALLLQRMGDIKGTRSVFLNFFRIVVLENDGDTECACSAKVLQAYALFEMKRGNAIKSLGIVTKAVKLDRTLAPVLGWKQFRDAGERLSRSAGRNSLAP